MSERKLHSADTQGVKHTDYCFDMISAGAAAPTLGEGDAAGSYVTPGRTGVGVYTITSKDPFVAVVATGFQMELTTPAGNWNIIEGPVPTQNTNGSWTVTINTFVGTVATELPAAGLAHIRCWIRYRNSLTKP
jgi:hypothetical protein